MKLKTSGIIALAATSALAFIGAASAGSKFIGNGSVVILTAADGSGTASGYLGHIYNGTGLVEYIGCQKYGNGGLFCHARTEGNIHVACSSTSAYLGNGVGTLAPDARLTFRFNGSGACTSITVTHSSEFQDKQG